MNFGGEESKNLVFQRKKMEIEKSQTTRNWLQRHSSSCSLPGTGHGPLSQALPRRHHTQDAYPDNGHEGCPLIAAAAAEAALPWFKFKHIPIRQHKVAYDAARSLDSREHTSSCFPRV